MIVYVMYDEIRVYTIEVDYKKSTYATLEYRSGKFEIELTDICVN